MKKQNKNSKQMLFEMMGKVDPSFKSGLNEDYQQQYRVVLKNGLRVRLDDPELGSDLYLNDYSLFNDILPEVGKINVIGLPGDLDNYFKFIKQRDGGFSKEKLDNNRLFRVNIQHAWDIYYEYNVDQE